MRFNSYMGQRSWGRRAQSPLVPLEKPIPGVFRLCVLLVVELRLLRSVVVSIGRAVTFHHAWHVSACAAAIASCVGVKLFDLRQLLVFEPWDM